MKSKKIILIMSILVIFCFIITGCNNNQQQKSEKPIIAVTIVPEIDFVKAVCGDLYEVVALVPPGNSPENYEPTPMEMEKFSQALIYFSIGVPTEENNIMPNVSKDTKVVKLDETVKTLYGELTLGNTRDPHIWLSPNRVMTMVNNIRMQLSELDPNNAELFEKNAIKYMTELQNVQKEIEDSLANIENRKIIVYHPAFGYFCDDFKLEMVALEEEGKEATAKSLTKIIDMAKNEGIKVIFYQEEIDSSQSKAFAEEIGGKTCMLSPLSQNYIENLKLMAKTIVEAYNADE
ncbi:MAG: zinc ABC transporter substrate-binding protein [Oscillospiraceae bacterium]